MHSPMGVTLYTRLSLTFYPPIFPPHLLYGNLPPIFNFPQPEQTIPNFAWLFSRYNFQLPPNYITSTVWHKYVGNKLGQLPNC